MPEANDEAAFGRVVRDEAAFADGVRFIAETLGVNARAERFADGSRPVYALGPELVEPKKHREGKKAAGVLHFAHPIQASSNGWHKATAVVVAIPRVGVI